MSANEVFSFVGLSVAGGIILGPGIPEFTIEGYTVAAVGDSVASHGTGPHAAATLVVPVPKYTIKGKTPALSGAPASCGCVVSTPIKYG